MPTETIETPAIELEPETDAAKILRLEAIIAKNETRGWNAQVDTVDGVKTVRQISDETQKFLDEMALSTAEAKRTNDLYESRNPDPHVTPDGQIQWRSQLFEKPLYGTEEAAERFVGRQRWAAMSKDERAQVRTLRASDVDRLNAADYFGKGSSSRKAAALMVESPAKYLALKAKAIEDGLL